MQIARTEHLVTDSLTPGATSKPGLEPCGDGEISFRRECFQRHDPRRVGSNRERHPRGFAVLF
jgi:hypothetical protein